MSWEVKQLGKVRIGLRQVQGSTATQRKAHAKTSTLFVVVFVVCPCPNDNWIRFYFLSQHYFILYYISVSMFLEVIINEFLVTLDL